MILKKEDTKKLIELVDKRENEVSKFLLSAVGIEDTCRDFKAMKDKIDILTEDVEEEKERLVKKLFSDMNILKSDLVDEAQGNPVDPESEDEYIAVDQDGTHHYYLIDDDGILRDNELYIHIVEDTAN